MYNHTATHSLSSVDNPFDLSKPIAALKNWASRNLYRKGKAEMVMVMEMEMVMANVNVMVMVMEMVDMKEGDGDGQCVVCHLPKLSKFGSSKCPLPP